MGFFSNLFGSNETKSNTLIFSKYAKTILSQANVKITDANLLKVTVYLCFAQIACLNSIAGKKVRPFIENMVEDANKSVRSLKVIVGELANSEDELETILADFPPEAEVDEDTEINGSAAWDAVYLGFAQDVILDIVENGKGPFGPHGYAAIKLLEALRGKGESESNFMEVSASLSKMTGEVIKAFR